MDLLSRSNITTQPLEINTFQNDFQKAIEMPQPSIRYIEGLSSRNTEKLANLLSLGWRTKITLQWLSEQEQAINQLPSSLQKPKDILSKMAMKLPTCR